MAIMSAASDTVPDKQTLAQFHRYVDLPAELRIKIIQEFIVGLRERLRSRPRSAGPLPFGKFAPFAVIHSEWQHEFEAEQELFGSLCLSTDDLTTYHGMVNQHRRDSLSKVTLRVLINNTAVEFNNQIDHIRGNTGVRSRASGFIVNSMTTILEGVTHVIHNGRQATRAGLELHTQIMVSGGEDHRGLRTALCSPDGIQCDFSQLPPLHTIRRFSQQGLKPRQLRALGASKVLFLNPSSLLAFVRWMPNLEEAVAGIPAWASVGDISGKFKYTGPTCSSPPYGSISQSH